MLRWDGSTWATYDHGAPSGKSVCDSIAATQGQLRSTTYRVYVYCTATDASAALYIAYGTSPTDTTFSWYTKSLSASVRLADGNVVAATVREDENDSSKLWADAYVKTTDLHIRKVQRNPSTGAWTEVDLGLPIEVTATTGGFVAVPNDGGYSRVFYVGAQGSEDYIYERTGNSQNVEPEYRNHGVGDSLQVVVNGQTPAEAKLAEYGGTVGVSLLQRPGSGGPSDWPAVYVRRSTNDADTFPYSMLVPASIGGTTYDYITDPTSTVTDGGRIYSLQLGLEIDACADDETITKAAIYLIWTDTGTSVAGSQLVEALTNGSSLTPLDHPWSDIEHRSGADVIHMAWWDVQNGRTRYAYYQDGVGLSSLRTIPKNSSSTPPRVTATDTGAVYIYDGSGTVRFCRLNSSGTACVGNTSDGWEAIPSPHTFTNSNTPVGTTGHSIRTYYGYSMVADEKSDTTLYFCYNKNETNGDGSDPDSAEEKDVFCTRGTRDEFLDWTWSSPVSVTGETNDDKDQFMPEVGITRDRTVFVSWYDRSDSSSNYTYRSKRAVSTDYAQSFSDPIDLYDSDSDPEYLPRHCFDSNIRFIGDFAAIESSTLHLHSLFVTVPSGTTTWTALRSSFGSLGAWFY